MIFKRIIPCLDVKDGRVVKGVRFKNLADQGDPVELAGLYRDQGADELCFLDISAGQERRGPRLKWVEQVARALNIPFTVGGGVTSVQDARDLLSAGADKVAINSAAVRRPELLQQLARELGGQSLVAAVDVKRTALGFEVMIGAGRETTGIQAESWLRRVTACGAGEILLTSMDRDGTGEGFDLPLLRMARSVTALPLIASGGMKTAEDAVRVFAENLADAALAAGVFHRRELTIAELKTRLLTRGQSVRPLLCKESMQPC